MLLIKTYNAYKFNISAAPGSAVMLCRSVVVFELLAISEFAKEPTCCCAMFLAAWLGCPGVICCAFLAANSFFMAICFKI